MSIERFFEKRYHPSKYNCAHFAKEVREYLNCANNEFLDGFLCGPGKREVHVSQLRNVKFLKKPVNGCLVWLRGIGTDNHVGVWFDGQVIHLTEAGVQYFPLDVVRIGFREVRFLC